jgi:hypothetical protein
MRLSLCGALVLILLLLPHWSFAAACCGGGANFPNLILSDDSAQLGLSANGSRVIGDAPSTGKPVFRSSADDEWVQNYTLDAAKLVSDRWQVGASIPYIRRSRSTSSQSASQWGWGDVSGMLGFEFLPEYSYSRWKPRGFLFLQTTFPTGGNIYESTNPYAVDARGKGFYTFSLGTFLIKSWNALDTSLRFALNKSLDRTFKAADGSDLTVRPGYDVNSAVSTGWSPGLGDWRLGLMLNPVYTAPTNASRYKLVWNTSLDVSRIIARSYVLGLSYNDQTLLGPAKNISLERGLMLFFRGKWER